MHPHPSEAYTTFYFVSFPSSQNVASTHFPQSPVILSHLKNSKKIKTTVKYWKLEIKQFTYLALFSNLGILNE